MIKNNDTITVIILVLISIVALIYGWMFFNGPSAEAFSNRIGGAEVGEAGYFWMRLIGVIYIALAIGNVYALLATPQECAVYYRAMITLTFFTFLRALWITMTNDESTTNLMPLIAQELVWLGFLTVYTRSGQRIGTNITWA